MKLCVRSNAKTNVRRKGLSVGLILILATGSILRWMISPAPLRIGSKVDVV